MPYSLRFVYFGYQCPHNTYLLARIKTLAWRESIQLHVEDITEDPVTCERYGIFSPTTLIVNERLRWLGPFSREEVLALVYDDDLPARDDPVRDVGPTVEGELVPITPDSVLATCVPCLRSEDLGLCRGKAEWAQAAMEDSGVEHLGYLHFMNGRCVGGAEYLPSLRIPYPIPDKRETNAFITCSFRSDEEKDYMSFPLRKLASDLKRFRYDTISVVSSTNTTFPNGPVSWFEEMGFEIQGVLIHEDLPDTDLVFMQLSI
jgi:hypothetical protein